MVLPTCRPRLSSYFERPRLGKTYTETSVCRAVVSAVVRRQLRPRRVAAWLACGRRRISDLTTRRVRRPDSRNLSATHLGCFWCVESIRVLDSRERGLVCPILFQPLMAGGASKRCSKPVARSCHARRRVVVSTCASAQCRLLRAWNCRWSIDWHSAGNLLWLDFSSQSLVTTSSVPAPRSAAHWMRPRFPRRFGAVPVPVPVLSPIDSKASYPATSYELPQKNSVFTARSEFSTFGFF